MAEPGQEGVPSVDARPAAGRARAILAAALPTISRLREYSPGWLRDDVVAGLTLSALLVPVGMGYAEAAGLPAIAGLYATIGALVAYFLFGPSRILVFGPDSVAPAAGRGGRRSPRRRRRRAGHGPRGGARDHGRGHVPGRGARAPRLRHRPPLAADPGRLHERDRPHDPRRPAPEAAGLLGGRDRRRRRDHRSSSAGSSTGRRCRPPSLIGLASLAVIFGLRRVSPPDPGRPRGRRRGGRRRAVFDLSSELKVVGEVPRGLPKIGLPAVTMVRPRDALPDGARHRPHLVRRHERHLARVRGAPRRAGRRRPRAGRPRGGQRGGRAGQRVRLERERDAHAGRRGRRLADAGDRPRRGGRDPAPARRGAGPPGAGADRRAGGRRHLGRREPLRRRGPAAPLAPAPVRAGARPHRLPRRDHLRRAAGDRRRGGPLPAQLHPARLAAARRHPGPRHRLQGLPRPRAPPGGAPGARPDPLPLGCPALLRQRRPVPRARPRDRRPRAAAGPLAGRHVGADDRHRHDGRGHAGRADHGACPARRGAPLRRHEGARQGPAADLRALRPAGRRPLPPDGGHRGQGLPRAPPGRGVAGLGGRAGAAAGPAPAEVGRAARPSRPSDGGLRGGGPLRPPG